MPSFDDAEFGEVSLRRVARAKRMTASVAPNGNLRISLPPYVPVFMAKRMVQNSRKEIRKLFSMRPAFSLQDGMQIGKSHLLHLRNGAEYSLKRINQQVILTITDADDINDQAIIRDVKSMIVKTLRREAKQHLPKRLSYLAGLHGYSFTSLRFTHASSRWGSCNQSKAISLNVALMNLPFELIDYVLIHELCHTVQLNHSKEFWNEVAKADPNYKHHKRVLRTFSPHL